MSPESASVWERSRRLAAQEIQDVAVRLFAAQGYDATTVAQISREAGVSQRTLFRYFGTKEDILCGEQEALGALLRETVTRQPGSVTAWDAMRTGFATIATANHSWEQTLEMAALIVETPALHASYVQKRARWRVELEPVLLGRTWAGGALDEHQARTVIAVAFACADAATATWVASRGARDVVALYDEAVAFARR